MGVPMSDVNRPRAQRLMQQAGLQAIVLSKPESYAWATGAPAGVASLFRRAGAALALLPAPASEPIAAVSTELFAAHANGEVSIASGRRFFQKVIGLHQNLGGQS
jgi:Xaa-Pro aminopeptidase